MEALNDGRWPDKPRVRFEEEENFMEGRCETCQNALLVSNPFIGDSQHCAALNVELIPFERVPCGGS